MSTHRFEIAEFDGRIIELWKLLSLMIELCVPGDGARTVLRERRRTQKAGAIVLVIN